MYFSACLVKKPHPFPQQFSELGTYNKKLSCDGIEVKNYNKLNTEMNTDLWSAREVSNILIIEEKTIPIKMCERQKFRILCG